MKNSYITLLLLLSFESYSLNIDGVLDEPEWKEAHTIATFYNVYPYTLEISQKKTNVKIFTNENGIYVGSMSGMEFTVQEENLPKEHQEYQR